VSIYKLAAIIGILIALVAAFVSIPYAVTLMTVAGVIVGVSILAEHQVRVIVSAVALTALAASFSELPAVGTYLTSIIANVGHVAAGAALFIILRNVVTRLTN
jgi:hypothetical protein